MLELRVFPVKHSPMPDGASIALQHPVDSHLVGDDLPGHQSNLGTRPSFLGFRSQLLVVLTQGQPALIGAGDLVDPRGEVGFGKGGDDRSDLGEDDGLARPVIGDLDGDVFDLIVKLHRCMASENACASLDLRSHGEILKDLLFYGHRPPYALQPKTFSASWPYTSRSPSENPFKINPKAVLASNPSLISSPKAVVSRMLST